MRWITVEVVVYNKVSLPLHLQYDTRTSLTLLAKHLTSDLEYNPVRGQAPLFLRVARDGGVFVLGLSHPDRLFIKPLSPIIHKMAT